MKKKRWAMVFAAEALLCAALTVLLRGTALFDAGILAFPFAQLGAGLRALSLMGGGWNVLAIALYLLLVAGAVGAAVWAYFKLFSKHEEDWLLFIICVTFGVTLYAMVNPQLLARKFFAGRELGPAMLGGLFYTELIVYVLLRLLRAAGEADTRALRRYVRWVLAAIAAVFVYSAFAGALQGCLQELEEISASNPTVEEFPQMAVGVAAPSLLWTQGIIVARYLLSAVSDVLGVWVILEALALLAAQDVGDAALASQCAEAIAKRSTFALRVTLWSGVVVNLYQVALARRLRSIALNVTLPLGAVAVCLGALLLARLMQGGIAPEGVAEARDGADQLRRNGRDRRPGDAPVEGENEQHVQTDVQDGREQQKQQRRDGIAHAAQKRADKVIEKLRADPGEDDRTVGMRGEVDRAAVRGDVDPCEHGIQQRERKRGQEDRQRSGEHDLRCERAADARLVVRADLAGGNDAEAGADAEGELKKDEDEGIGVVDAGDLLRGERLPDDGGVADGIDLLEQEREDDRKREAQNGFPAAPFGQIDRLEKGMHFRFGACSLHKHYLISFWIAGRL